MAKDYKPYKFRKSKEAMMPIFRKKPVVIEAIRYVGDNAQEIIDWIGTCQINRRDPYLEISTLEGVMVVTLGDWVIKGTRGEFYPCKDLMFQDAYEPCENSDG